MRKNLATNRTAIVRDLLVWYDQMKRKLPWRETSDPYRIWVSEVMLQQTQVDTVIPYYHRFLTAFPDLETLARAPLQEVLKIWENLGYYSRARNLHVSAGIIVTRFGGRVPDEEKALKTLPGIGPYTAGAILSIAYGQATPAIDGNVRRILCRLFALQDPVDHPQTQKQLDQIASGLVPRNRPGDYNQALMDLGATICRAKMPGCAPCPLTVHCRSHAMGSQDLLPIMTKRAPVPLRQAAAAVIRDRMGRLLMVQRPASGLLASLWTFPGGFFQDSGDRGIMLKKRVLEDLGLYVRIGPLLTSVHHAYTHFRIALHAYEARITKVQSTTCPAWVWASPEDLAKMPLSKIDRMLIKAILDIGEENIDTSEI